MKRAWGWFGLTLSILAWGANAQVTDSRLAASDAQAEPGQWLAHGRGLAEQRYSPLDQIDATNVESLGLAWSYDVGDKIGLQGTPLVVDGVMYVTSGWSVVHALDAATGERLWRFDPQVPRDESYRYCCGFINRGVAAYADKIFVGTLDGRLIALEATTGRVVWSTQTVPTGDSGKSYSISGAPRVAKGKVLIGNAGAEFAGTRGYVSAYEPETGALAWRFFTVPGDPALGFETPQMELAAQTWTGEWWKIGGGGTVWDSIAYDPELDLVYIGVGNGTPHNRKFRSPDGGDNLFLCSIIALRPDTGEYVWHYQEIPAETWDYTATQNMILAEIEWQGEKRDVLMQAPKAGFFYILDRATGQLLSAEPFARKVTWASHYDMETGRPVEVEGQDFSQGPVMLAPLGLGAHNWHPMSYSPRTGLVYIPAQDVRAQMQSADRYVPDTRNFNTGMNTDSNTNNMQLTQTMMRALMKGYLLAWDPSKQSAAWGFDHASISNGGTLATGGDLVFQGTVDGQFYAFDARSGAVRWRYETQNGIVGSPISYAVSGAGTRAEQYVAIPAARGGGLSQIAGLERGDAKRPSSGRILAFKLGARRSLPPEVAANPIPDPPPMPEVGSDTLSKGRQLYGNHCNRCHGSGAVGDGSITDLRHLPSGRYANFENVVLDGELESVGMPRFPNLDGQDVAAIRAYVLEQSHQDWDRREGSRVWWRVKQFAYDALAWILF